MVLLWAGGLLLLAALLLTLRNLGEENQAARQAEGTGGDTAGGTKACFYKNPQEIRGLLKDCLHGKV